MPKWEYKVIIYKKTKIKINWWGWGVIDKRIIMEDYDQELNKLGNEGWELTGILQNTARGFLDEFHLILKRQVNE
ncbi:MAG: DUF4177 domain-containing protein [Candidatus Poribacteria bacterium]